MISVGQFWFTHHFGCRYLVPADLTVGQFVYVVRKRIKLSAEKAIFIFVKNVLPPTGGENLNLLTIIFYLSHLLVLLLLLLSFSWQMICMLSVTTAAMMSAIYEENKDEDGFLYMTYSGENTFGDQWKGSQAAKSLRCQWTYICIFLALYWPWIDHV